jgi:alkylhydroperoxidase family enzyme
MHAYHAFNGHILSSSTLTPRDRELAILRVAALRDADYEWEQHVVIAGGAGIADEEIERVRAGADAPGWSEHDAAMLLAVDELVADAMVSDVTWGKLAETFDTQQLMDFVFTVGAYDLLAMAFRSFGIELDADLAPPAS